MFKLYILLYFVRILTGNRIFLYEKTNFQVKYFANLMEIYEKFDKIFHVDDETEHESSDFVNNFGTKFLHQVMIYNHDYYGEHMKRPKGGKILNVIFLSNLTKLETYLSDYANVNGKDVAILVTYRKKYGKILRIEENMKYRPGAGNFLILNVQVDKIEMYHVCQYCGRYDNRLDLLQVAVNSSEVVIGTRDLMPIDFRNFYGHEFTILFNQYYPFMFCETYEQAVHLNKTYNKCLSWIGSEANLLGTLSKKMDFTYKLLALTEYITVPKMLPYLYKDEKIDFAIGGIEISAPRIRKLLFTRLTNFENIALMYKMHIEWTDRLFAFLNAFNGKIWLFLGLSSFAYSIAIFLFVSFLYGKKSSITFPESLQIPLRITIEQPMVPNCLTNRIKFPMFVLLSSWMIGSIELNTMYKSNLASQIIHPPVEKYNNVFELIDKGYKIGMEDIRLKYLNYTFKKSETDMESFKKNFFNLTVLCKGVDMVLEKKVALAGERSFLSCHCQKTRTNYYVNDVNFASEPLTTIGHGWLFRSGIPYVDAFNKNILSIQAVGLMDKWFKDVLWKNRKFFKKSKTIESVALDEFVCHFTLYVIGMTTAIIALIEYVNSNMQSLINFLCVLCLTIIGDVSYREAIYYKV